MSLNLEDYYSKKICPQIRHELGRIRNTEIGNLLLVELSSLTLTYSIGKNTNFTIDKYEIVNNKQLVTQVNDMLNKCNSFLPNYKSNLTSINEYKSFNYQKLLLIDYDDINNPQVIFYVEIENNSENIISKTQEGNTRTNIIWTLCKTDNPKYRYVKTNVILNTYLESQINKRKKKSWNPYIIIRYWCAVDITNPKFEEIVKFFLRANFAIKGVTNLPGTISNNYNQEQRYIVLESISSKKGEYANVTKLANLNEQYFVASGLRTFEQLFKYYKKTYYIPAEDLLKIFYQVYTSSGEVSGSFNISLSKYYSFIKGIPIVLDKLVDFDKPKINKILYDQKHKLNLYEQVKDNDALCQTKAPTAEFIFHTHPYICNNKLYLSELPRIYEPPSQADLFVTIFKGIKTGIGIKIHFVFTVNSIYIIQLNPYWQNIFNVYFSAMRGQKIIDELVEILLYIQFLILNNQRYHSLITNGLKNKEDMYNYLFLLNNNMTISELSRDIDHTEFKDYKGTKKTNEEIKKDIKERLISTHLKSVKNYNLFMISLVPYPINLNFYPDIPKDVSGKEYDPEKFTPYFHNELYVKDNYSGVKAHEYLTKLQESIGTDKPFMNDLFVDWYFPFD